MSKICRSYFPLIALLFTVMLMAFGSEVKGQCTKQVRTYANFQGAYLEGLGVLGSPTLAGGISNPGYAVNGNVKQASTLNIGVGLLGLAGSTQFLEFTTDGTHANKRLIAANTPVTIKLTLPKEVLGLLSGVEIGTFTGLNAVSESWPVILGTGHYSGFNSTNRVSAYSGASLLGLLSGAGEFEATITPGSAYNGVYIKLSGNALSVALTADVFHAYIMENAVGNINCNTTIDVVAGVRAGSAVGGIANATGSVTNQWNAIDSDQNSFALLSTGVQVLSQVYETAIFNSPSTAGDSIKIILQDPGETLLDLSLLNGFKIQPYLKNIAAGPAFLSSDIFLSLKLLPSSGNKYTLTLPVTSPYDRVEILMGGVAGALSGLRIYDITQITPTPIIQSSGMVGQNLTICAGQTPTLSISNSQTSSCITYTWYEGLTIKGTGTTFSPTGLIGGSTHTYTVKAARTGCSESTQSIPVMVTVNTVPTVPIGTAAAICDGSNGIFNVTAPIVGYTYNWYTTASGTTPILTGPSVTTSNVLTVNTTYYLEAVNGTCIGPTRAPITIVVNPNPTLSSSLTPPAICSNSVFNYTPTSPVSGTIFTWTRAAVTGISNSAITVPTSGAISEILINTTDSPIDVTYSYTLIATGCQKQYDIIVTVNPIPTLTSPQMPPAICSNTTFSYTPTSNTTSTTFKWTRAAVAGISNAAVTIQTPGSINETLINTTSDPVIVTYVYYLTKNGCTKTQGILLTVYPSPSITLGNNPGICQGITSISFSYSNSIANPTTYSIIWDATASNAGFLPITNSTLPTSPITLTVPANVPVNTYNGTLTVKNDNDCISPPISFNVIIHTRPGAPQIITQ